MATVTQNNGIAVLPSLGDFAELYRGMVITSASATAIVVENAFGKLTLTALGTDQFTYAAGSQMPTGGKVTSLSYEVFSDLGTLVPYFSLSYPAGSELGASGFFSSFGVFIEFTGPDTIFTQSDSITGSASSDWLQGRAGNDTIVGGAGDDTLDGGIAVDQMTGGAGDDVYVVDAAGVNPDIVTELAGEGRDTVAVTGNFSYTLAANVENLEVAPAWAWQGYYIPGGQATGNDLNNIMRGNTSADNLSGGAGNDRLFGNDQNDTLSGGTGDDTMVGGDGDDDYNVDAAGDRVIESSVPSSRNASPGIDRVFTSISFTLPGNVENLTLLGTTAIDGTGNTLDNLIVANNGNNTIDGREGVDTLSYFGNGAALTVSLNITTAQATGGSGTDTILRIENLIGGNFSDKLTGNNSDNRLDGSGGADTLAGLLGDDTYVVDNAGDSLSDTGGTETVESSVSWTLGGGFENLNLSNYNTANGVGVGNLLANTIRGSDGNNLLQGLGGNDTLLGGTFYSGSGYTGYGGTGDDTLDGGTGADSMVGGYGNDTYIVDNAGDIVVEGFESNYSNNPVVDTVRSSVNYVLPLYVENLVLTGTAVRGAGNSGNNVITANDANNLLNGGLGNDTLSYEGTTAALTVTLAVQGLQLTGGSGSDSIRNFENLTGGSGNDTLTGHITDNVLNGGAGDDSLSGGKGNDTYVVDSALDVVVEALNSGTDLLQTTVAYTLPANVENLQVIGALAGNGTGNTLGNQMNGNAAANRLEGLGGNDTLNGAGGQDTLDGGVGNDVYLLNAKTGITILDAGGIDTVRLDSLAYSASESPYLLPDAIENVELYSSNQYSSIYFSGATGNALDNRMMGGAQKNTLNGGDGNDTLIGAGESDTLTGGAGSDVFMFDAPLQVPDAYGNLSSSGIDTITDFTVGVDRIHIDDNAFPALPLTSTGAFLDIHLVIGAAATSAEDRIVYDSSTGNLFYDPDGDGAQAQVQFAQLQTGLALTAADFLTV